MISNVVKGVVRHPIRPVVGVSEWTWSPSVLEGTIFWSRVTNESRTRWNREEFQLNNNVRLEGLPNGEIPFFSGADNNLERVTLDSTITLDCTVGFRVDLTFCSNGSLTSGDLLGFGFIGNTGNNDGFYGTVAGISVTGNQDNTFISITTSLIYSQIVQTASFRCNGTSIDVYIDDILVGSSLIGSLTSIEINSISNSRLREAQGLLYDIKINDVDNSENWTHHYSGINGDWSDQIGSNNGTAGVNLKYIKNNHNNLKAKTGGYYVADSATQDYVDTNTTLTFGSKYEGFGWVRSSSGSTQMIIDSRDAGLDGFFVQLVTGNIRLGHNSTDITTSSTYNDGNWYMYHYRWDGSDVYVSIYDENGNLQETVTSAESNTLSITTNAKIGNRSFSTSLQLLDGDVKDMVHRGGFTGDFRLQELISNPQNFNRRWFSEIGNVDFAYSFNQGNGEVGYTVWDLSVNEQHGTIQSNSAPAGTNFIYNDAEVGSQQVLESRNVYYWLDGVDDSFSFSSRSLANKTITLRLQYKTTGEYQFFQLSDAAITDRYLAGTINFTSGYKIGITSYVGSTGVILNSYYYNGSLTNDELITVVITTDAGGVISGLSVNGFVGTNSPAPTNQSRVQSTAGQNHFYLGARQNNLFAYHGIIDYFNYDDEIISYNHTGFEGSTINGSPKSIFIPESSTLGIDLFGNTIENRWKQGLLNFTGLDLVDNAHGGVEWGDQIDVADVSERTIERSLEYVYNASDIVLDTNGVVGVSGYELKISSTGKVVYTNGANTPLESTTTLTDGTKYDIILHHTGTTAELFITELGSSHSTADASGTVGAIDAGTVIPNISGNSLTTPSIHFDGDTTESEKTNLSKYNNSKY